MCTIPPRCARRTWVALVLETRRLSVNYGPLRALHNVSCAVSAGEIVSVLGPNGAGKSSLNNAIAGLIPHSSGELLLGGEEIGRMPAHRRARLGLCLVMERRHLFPLMTVRENLLIGAHSLSRSERVKADIGTVLPIFPGLAPHLNTRAGALSGGQQQMVAIARGLMGRPKVLMIDEPFLGLTPAVAAVITDVLLELRSRGVAVMFIEQNVNIAMSISDRVYLLQHGELAFAGTPEEAGRTNIIDHVYFGKERGADNLLNEKAT